MIKTAKEIGYPLVMKIASSQVIHKSDTGGVILNIQNESALIESYEKIDFIFVNDGSTDDTLLLLEKLQFS